jgi:hypothetical protein
MKEDRTWFKRFMGMLADSGGGTLALVPWIQVAAWKLTGNPE